MQAPATFVTTPATAEQAAVNYPVDHSVKKACEFTHPVHLCFGDFSSGLFLPEPQSNLVYAARDGGSYSARTSGKLNTDFHNPAVVEKFLTAINWNPANATATANSLAELHKYLVSGGKEGSVGSNVQAKLYKTTSNGKYFNPDYFAKTIPVDAKGQLTRTPETFAEYSWLLYSKARNCLASQGNSYLHNYGEVKQVQPACHLVPAFWNGQYYTFLDQATLSCNNASINLVAFDYTAMDGDEELKKLTSDVRKEITAFFKGELPEVEELSKHLSQKFEKFFVFAVRPSSLHVDNETLLASMENVEAPAIPETVVEEDAEPMVVPEAPKAEPVVEPQPEVETKPALQSVVEEVKASWNQPPVVNTAPVATQQSLEADKPSYEDLEAKVLELTKENERLKRAIKELVG